jgi:hypothetical protein
MEISDVKLETFFESATFFFKKDIFLKLYFEVISFSLGKLQCLSELLARAELLYVVCDLRTKVHLRFCFRRADANDETC